MAGRHQAAVPGRLAALGDGLAGMAAATLAATPSPFLGSAPMTDGETLDFLQTNFGRLHDRLDQRLDELTERGARHARRNGRAWRARGREGWAARSSGRGFRRALGPPNSVEEKE